MRLRKDVGRLLLSCKDKVKGESTCAPYLKEILQNEAQLRKKEQFVTCTSMGWAFVQVGRAASRKHLLYSKAEMLHTTYVRNRYRNNQRKMLKESM